MTAPAASCRDRIVPAALAILFLSSVTLAQPAAQNPEGARPAVNCGGFSTSLGYSRIVLVNGLDTNGNKVCKFAQRTLEPIETQVGFNVLWSFCSECDLDARVTLDTWNGDLVDYFRSFRPSLQADNTVQSGLIIAHSDNASIDGISALIETPRGLLTYKAHLLSSTNVVTDIIDPQLQIKRGGTFSKLVALLLSAFFLVLGFAGGRWFARRRV
jgi:hypothetical protein